MLGLPSVSFRRTDRMSPLATPTTSQYNHGPYLNGRRARGQTDAIETP